MSVTSSVAATRPDITLALDVRSYERVVIIADPNSGHTYPEEWDRPSSPSEISVDRDTVIIVDRVELSRKVLTDVMLARPRIMAFACANIEGEKQLRRLLKSLQPFAEVWDVSTSFGKVLVTCANGVPYDRDTMIDMREAGTA